MRARRVFRVLALLGLGGGCHGDPTSPAAMPDAGRPRPGRDFVCNQVIGLQATGQWYAAGFEQDGVDDAHWQAKTQHRAYIEKWADPNNAVWDQPLTSPCASRSDDPDRVVFVGFSPPSMTEAAWEASLIADIDTIRAKYPGLQEVDVMSMVRSPGNQPCPMNTDPLVVTADYVDQAIGRQ
jgi:hypothetical protein